MRHLLRNRRGSVAFATVIALVPLIGVMALGGEAAIWYATKQQAQTAADAAAYAGALRLACGRSVSCDDGESVLYRGYQFAAQNAFCDANDPNAYFGSRCATTLPTGITHSVLVEQLDAKDVRATVRQTQPAYLAAVLGLTTVNVSATAIARVILVANPCVVSLENPLFFKGDAEVDTSVCGIASNSKASNSIDFTGKSVGITDLGAVAGQGGCEQTSGTFCNEVIKYAPPVPNPLSALNGPMASLTATIATFTGGEVKGGKATGKCAGSAPVAYDSRNSATSCYNDKITINSDTALNGVYFFAGFLKFSGSPKITGTATLIMLPGATIDFAGTPQFGSVAQPFAAPTTIQTWQVPTALQGSRSLMSGLLIYVSETTATDKYVKIQGNNDSRFNGVVYAPNANIEYTGSANTGGCNMVIAKGIRMSGSSDFSNSGCPATARSEINVVRMVQ